MTPDALYLSLMTTMRGRFDTIDTLRSASGDEFARAESAAFHGRKIIEAIAFGCLIAVDNAIKTIPRDAVGQWNAETILKRLDARNLSVFPSPSRLRDPTAEEAAEHHYRIVIEGIPDRRLTRDALIKIYQSLHPWLHEVNPYTTASHQEFCRGRAPALWSDLARVRLFVDKHVMTIGGAGFFAILKDDTDGRTKLIGLQRPPGYVGPT